MISRFTLFLLAIIVTLNFARADETMVVATVNGDQITAEMMAEELGRIHSAQSEEAHRSDFSLDRLLQKLINNRLIVQDAYSLGIDQELTVRDAVRWFRETMAYQMLLDDIVPKDVIIPESDLRDGFKKYYRRAMLRLICVTDSTLSVAIADSINNGVSMASLATRHAVDKYKNLGGDAGVFPLYDIPQDLSKKLETASDGQLFGPMFLWNTWAVVRTEAFLPADDAIYDSVKAIVQTQLLIDKGSLFRHGFIHREGASIPVWVDSVAVDSIPIRMAMGLDANKATVLRVGQDRELSASDLQNKYVHRIVGRGDREGHEVLWEAFDEQYQVMMLKEIAGQKSYIDDPRLDGEASVFRDSMMVVTYLQSVIGPTVKVSDAEIKAYYDANPTKFYSSNRFLVAVITRATQEEAQADYDRILAGADFTWIAKQFSIDEFKERGGVREWATAAQFPPELAAQLDTMALGTCLAPLSGSEGFVILRLVDREAGARQSLADAKSAITAVLEQQKQFSAIETMLLELRTNADIQINDSALRGLQVSGPTGN